MEGSNENNECALRREGDRNGKYIHTNARHVSVHRLTFVREAYMAYVEEVRLITCVQCAGWFKS
jgi:hypothetical protein